MTVDHSKEKLASTRALTIPVPMHVYWPVSSR